MFLYVCASLIGCCVGSVFTILTYVCMMRSFGDGFKRMDEDYSRIGCGSRYDPVRVEPLAMREIDSGTFSAVDIELLKIRRLLPASAPTPTTPTGVFPVYSSRERIERLPVSYVNDGDTAWFEVTDDDVGALLAGDTYFVGT